MARARLLLARPSEFWARLAFARDKSVGGEAKLAPYHGSTDRAPVKEENHGQENSGLY